jgi:hypothetical protein
MTTDELFSRTSMRLAEAALNVDEWTVERNRLIHKLSEEEGASLRQIAWCCGLSHTAIAKILART